MAEKSQYHDVEEESCAVKDDEEIPQLFGREARVETWRRREHWGSPCRQKGSLNKGKG
jgi:hypothetical protein